MDIRKENLERLEMEINQIGYPFGMEELPPVYITSEKDLFDCDVLIFCASRGVPPVSDGAPDPSVDVRMVQLEANREIIKHYADLAKAAGYKGMIAVVSDPVDNLVAAFLDAAELKPWQVQGYGLGVMNMRALYYSERIRDHSDSISLYREEGRAYGPHGQDLVIANSIDHYDEQASLKLTELTTSANLKVRELGFKPYIAPALSSAAISILLTLRGEWHYGSVYMGSREKGAFVGVRNRLTDEGFEYEDLPLPDMLYDRILTAYRNLCEIR
jgi:malate/lactate dehydrogenase